MEATRQVLQSFAQGTCHREYELENVGQIARKFLAIQAPIVDDWKTVYPYVCNDLARVTFRSLANQSPDHWNAEKAVPLEVYRYLAPTESVLKRGAPHAYTDYTRHLDQLPIGQLPKEDYPTLFLMHGARKKNLRALLGEMYPERSDRELETLNLHICNYRTHQHDTPLHLASEIGTVLANMPMPQIDEFGQVYLISTADAEPNYSATPTVTKGVVGDVILAPSTSTVASEKHMERLSHNPILAEYRKNAGIASHFSTEKQMKQVLASLLDPDATIGNVNASIVGKRQTRLGNVATLGQEDWKQVIEAATCNLPTNVTEIPQVVDFYKTLGTAMPRDDLQAMTAGDLIQHMITAHLDSYDALWPTNAAIKKAIGKYLTKYPQVGEPVLKALGVK